MNIHWKFDEEDEWDPYTLLGDMNLIDDEGNHIGDKCIILDIWFKSLFEGLQALREDKEKIIDLIDEPDPLCFSIEDGTKFVGYKDKKIKLHDVDRALRELKTELDNFINKALSHPGSHDSVTMEGLKKIINL